MSNINSNVDMRTPLAKVLGLGAAKSGTLHFWQQRITGLFNVPLYLFFLCLTISVVGKGYVKARHVFSCPVISLLAALALISGIYHMKIGLQVVIEDYVHNHISRIICLALNSFLCYGLLLACLLAVLKLSVGV